MKTSVSQLKVLPLHPQTAHGVPPVGDDGADEHPLPQELDQGRGPGDTQLPGPPL